MAAEDLVIVIIPFIGLVVLLYFYFRNLVRQLKAYLNDRNNALQNENEAGNENNNNNNPIVVERTVRIMIVENPNKYFKNDSTDTCPICIEEMKIEPGQEDLAYMNCEHTYHKDCIVEWLKINSTCPICRN